jgi:hypothetical protein
MPAGKLEMSFHSSIIIGIFLMGIVCTDYSIMIIDIKEGPPVNTNRDEYMGMH